MHKLRCNFLLLSWLHLFDATLSFARLLREHSVVEKNIYWPVNLFSVKSKYSERRKTTKEIVVQNWLIFAYYSFFPQIEAFVQSKWFSRNYFSTYFEHGCIYPSSVRIHARLNCKKQLQKLNFISLHLASRSAKCSSPTFSEIVQKSFVLQFIRLFQV